MGAFSNIRKKADTLQEKEQKISNISTTPTTYAPTPISLGTEETGQGQVITPKIERKPITFKEFVKETTRPITFPIQSAKQVITEGIPKAVSQTGNIPELFVKTGKGATNLLQRIPALKESPKLTELTRKLNVADEAIDDWQASFRNVFNKEDKNTAEKVGAFIGEEIVPFFVGSGVATTGLKAVKGLSSAQRLIQATSKIDNKITRSIFRGALNDIITESSISLGQNDSKEEYAFNLATGLAIGTVSDVVLSGLAKKYGQSKVKIVTREAIEEANKIIRKGGDAKMAQDAFLNVFENSFQKEGRMVGLKTLGEEADRIRSLRERILEDEKFLQRTDITPKEKKTTLKEIKKFTQEEKKGLKTPVETKKTIKENINIFKKEVIETKKIIEPKLDESTTKILRNLDEQTKELVQKGEFKKAFKQTYDEITMLGKQAKQWYSENLEGLRKSYGFKDETTNEDIYVKIGGRQKDIDDYYEMLNYVENAKEKISSKARTIQTYLKGNQTIIEKTVRFIPDGEKTVLRKVDSTAEQSKKHITKKLNRLKEKFKKIEEADQKIKLQNKIDKLSKSIDKIVDKEKTLNKDLQKIKRREKAIDREEAQRVLRSKNVELKEAKETLIKYAKETLPKDKEGNIKLSKAKQVLNAIKEANTKESLAKAFSKIDKVIADVKKSNTVAEIKKLYKTDKSKLPLENQKYIEKIMEGKQVSKLSQEKRIKLIESRKNLMDVDLEKLGKANRKLLEEANERLEGEALADLSQSELNWIETLLRREIEEGKEKMALKLAKKEQSKKITLERLKNKSLNTDFKTAKEITGKLSWARKLLAKPEKVPTKELSFLDTKKIKIYSALDRIQKADFGWTTPDNLMQIADDGVMEGLNYKTFKVPIDDGMNKYNTIKNNIVTDFNKIDKKLKLKDEQFEKIIIHAYKMQEGGREQMIKAGLPKQLIDSVKLTKEENEMYEFMLDELAGMHPLINDIMIDVHNKELPNIKNYFPIHVDRAEDILSSIDDSYKKDRINKGFVEERKGGEYKMKFNAKQVFLNHIDNASYFIGLEKAVKNADSLAKSPVYGEAVGQNLQKEILLWLNQVKRKGTAGREVGDAEKFVDLLSRNIGIAQFAGNFISAGKQVLVKLTSASLLGSHAFKHTADMFASPSIYKRINELSTQQRFRAFDDPVLAEMQGKITKAGFVPMRVMDKLASQDTWYGAYRKYLADSGIKWDKQKFLTETNKDAIRYADLIVRKTNGSSEIQNIARHLTKNNSAYNRAFLKFQNFIIGTETQLIRNELLRWGLKDKKTAAQVIIFLYLSGLAEQKISEKWQQYIWGEKAKEWQEKTPTKQTLNIFASKLPLINNVVSVLEYDSNGNPIFDRAKDALQSVDVLLSKDFKTDYAREKAINDAILAVGSVSGIPATKIATDINKRRILEKYDKRD